jgi:hypothetical protein
MVTEHRGTIALLLCGPAIAWWLLPTVRAPGPHRTQPAGNAVAQPAQACLTEAARGPLAIPRHAAPPPASTPEPTAAASGIELAFALEGVAPGGCRGSVVLYRHRGDAVTLPIAASTLRVPVIDDLRKVELAVDGCGIADYTGPFTAQPEPIRVPLLPATNAFVDVIDAHGRPLAGRLVYLLPQGEAPEAGRIAYRTTAWAFTDERGRAHVAHVLPGQYRIWTVAIAEWCEATSPSLAIANGPTWHRLEVAVLDPGTHGGFTFPADRAPFLSCTSAGVVCDHRFWCDDGRSAQLYRVDGAFRCVVAGAPGEVVRGSVQRRDGSGRADAHAPRSSPITVTIGAMTPVAPAWIE